MREPGPGRANFDRISRPGVLLDETRERVAKAIHEDYRRHRQAGGGGSVAEPSMLPWEQLPESLRDSNRRQAADIGRKLAAIGCDIEPLLDRNAPPLVFTPAEVELLARMEHDRWRKERESDGWTYALEKDVERKKSPYLVPWEDLSEEIRDRDRAPIRAMPAVLAAAGFSICRVG